MREVYEELEQVARLLEQHDDEYEFVLVAGLLSWKSPDGTHIRRHLISEPLISTLDPDTAEVVVRRDNGGRRLEDKDFLEGREGYFPARAEAARARLAESDTSLLDPAIMSEIGAWLTNGLDHPIRAAESRTDMSDEPTSTVEICDAPAMWLRPRSRVLLADAYRHIADELAKPGAQIPVALAQLVVETERSERDRWLAEQGAVTGDLLGIDPLFPLDTNDEQERVMNLLRTETTVVVQGPPGTGKTHTIANLISTLMARGQRVLVTSQKEQALRLLREKIPGDLRRLCVLMAGGNRDVSAELQQGLDTLSEAVASSASQNLDREAELLAEQRLVMRQKAVELNRRILDIRESENIKHDAVVSGCSAELYRGTLAEIVRAVRGRESLYDWLPTVPENAPSELRLSTSELLELRRLMMEDSPERQVRGVQFMPDQHELPSAGEYAKLVNAERGAAQKISGDADELARSSHSACGWEPGVSADGGA